MGELIWIDWVIITIIAVSTLVSIKRGFVREALSLITWIGAFIIARTFHPQMQSLLEPTVETPIVRLVAAFAILFVGTLIVGAVINNLIAQLVRVTGLSATDRLLGTVFGLLRGVIIIVVAIAFTRYTPLSRDTWWHSSVMIQKLAVVESWSRRVMGDEFERILGTDGEPAQTARGLPEDAIKITGLEQ